MDRRHLKNQVERIDEIARLKIGTPVRHNRDDLELLQRIVNKGLIDQDDSLRLQALGAVFGNVLAKELNLQWVIYEDDLGRSRALCVQDTQHCLFPITMLSRRLEVGILVNVNDIYNKAVKLISPYLPRQPFASKPRDLF